MLQGRTPLIIAAVFAVLAGIVAYLLVANERKAITKGWDPVEVIVANRDMQVGDTLTRDSLAVSTLPRRSVTKSVVTKEGFDRAPVAGRKLDTPMLTGDVLLYSHIHTLTGDQKLSNTIQEKGRAVSVRVSPESAVHHWIEPGDRVDVLGVFRDGRRDMSAVTMLQNVIVLATGRIGGRTNRRLLNESERSYNTVTLHVLPEAAEMLVLGQELGQLYLTLRSPEDNEIYDLGEGSTSLSTLLTGERSKQISKTQSKMFKVEIIRGQNRETQTVPKLMDVVVLLATAGAVFFLSVVVVDVLRRAFGEYEERYLAKRVSDLSEMFFFVGPRQLVVLTFAATSLGAALGLLLFGPVVMFILVALGVSTPTLLVRFYRARRTKRFERQLVDALGGMAAAFRSGMTLQQAMEELSKTGDVPLSQEFGLTVREMRLGSSTEEALEHLGRRVDSDDLQLVITAVVTARALGGNLAEMFDRLAKTIRERFRIEGRIRSLTAQGRLQGIVIGLMPVIVWLAFDSIRPDLTRPMLSHWFGYAIIALIVVMEILGGLFIRRIVSIRV